MKSINDFLKDSISFLYSLVNHGFGHLLKYIILKGVLIKDFLESKAIFVFFVVYIAVRSVFGHIQSYDVAWVFGVEFIKLNRKKVCHILEMDNNLHFLNIWLNYAFFSFGRLKPTKYLNRLFDHFVVVTVLY